MNSGITITKPWALFMAFLASVLLLNASARAQEIDPNDPYFQIAEIKTEVVRQTEHSSEKALEKARLNFQNQSVTLNAQGYEATRDEVDPMAIADLLFKVWDVVVANKPLVTTDLKGGSALPNLAANHWEALSGWKRERAITYSMSVTNLYGIKVVSMDYQVKLIYGGGVRGKGLYIASARVVPIKIDVLWGYNLDVTAAVPVVTNMGTEDDPLAALYLDVNYKVHTVIRTTSDGQSYLLQGDGLMMNTKTQKMYYDSIPRI